MLDLGIESEKNREMLPIMSPLFNMREICKQSALLEDHLNNPRKQCPDCIRKHFLTIEALFEEAISLDENQEYGQYLDGKAELCRLLQEEWMDGEAPKNIAQSIRGMRKDFSGMCFDTRKMASVSRISNLYSYRRIHVCGRS